MYTIGHCVLGSTSTGIELTHWQQMISNPRRPSAMWHWLHKSSKKLKQVTKSERKGTDSEPVVEGTDCEANEHFSDVTPPESSETQADLIYL